MPSQADQDIAVEASLLTTGLGSAAVVDDGTVPVIDLSAGSKEQVAAKLWEAATQVGFFTVVGHGIDQALIQSAFQVSEQFFAQPLEEKKKQSPLDMSINCGFEYFSQVRPSTGAADQKESLQITARKGAMDGRWPTDKTQFRDTAEKLLVAAHALAGQILDLLEPEAVPHVKPGTISSSHTLWKEDGQCTLRFLHYPPLEKDVTEKLLADNYWRAGAHTDWDNVTLLFQREPGLECCANPRTGDPKNMYWTAVSPTEGGIAVNIGDMLARWSDGKLHSNLHRVRLPKDASQSRYSIAYFAQSDKKQLIECQDSDAITAGDYILSRIKSNFSSA